MKCRNGHPTASGLITAAVWMFAQRSEVGAPSGGITVAGGSSSPHLPSGGTTAAGIHEGMSTHVSGLGFALRLGLGSTKTLSAFHKQQEALNNKTNELTHHTHIAFLSSWRLSVQRAVQHPSTSDHDKDSNLAARPADRQRRHDSNFGMYDKGDNNNLKQRQLQQGTPRDKCGVSYVRVLRHSNKAVPPTCVPRRSLCGPCHPQPLYCAAAAQLRQQQRQQQ